MARTRRSRGTIEVDVTAEVSIDDVLEDLTDEEIIEEAKTRGLSISVAAKDHGEDANAFLEGLANTLESGRVMDVHERRLTAMRIREILPPDDKRAAAVAEAYGKWKASRSSGATH